MNRHDKLTDREMVVMLRYSGQWAYVTEPLLALVAEALARLLERSAEPKEPK